MTARLRRARQCDRGFTLVEFLVTIAILAVVLSMTMSTAVSVYRATFANGRTEDTLTQARLGMEVTTKALRTASRLKSPDAAFTAAAPQLVDFYGHLDTTGRAQRVRFSLETTTIGTEQVTSLVQQTWTADAASVLPDLTYTGTPRRRVVARYLDPAYPIFTFFGADNVPLAATPAAADRVLVRAVGISLRIRRGQGASGTAETVLQTRVRLPNASVVVQ
jgi:prepilin-type N-terminal cleavage/methylation domain-containing protein